MPWRHSAGRLALLAALVSATPAAAAPDPINATCPEAPGWAAYPQMRFTLDASNGTRVLRAEGVIDDGAATRLAEALTRLAPVEEIWLSSPGGDARAGNAAGRIIRSNFGLMTRIPAGWACFSACNFIFMGGQPRVIDPGGLFIVHMFTRTGDRQSIDMSVAMGTDATKELIGDIEQDAALLASEDNDFLIRMGVSRKLLTEVMYRQKAIANAEDKSTRRCLTQAEVKTYNVANNNE